MKIEDIINQICIEVTQSRLYTLSYLFRIYLSYIWKNKVSSLLVITLLMAIG